MNCYFASAKRVTHRWNSSSSWWRNTQAWTQRFSLVSPTRNFKLLLNLKLSVTRRRTRRCESQDKQFTAGIRGGKIRVLYDLRRWHSKYVIISAKFILHAKLFLIQWEKIRWWTWCSTWTNGSGLCIKCLSCVIEKALTPLINRWWFLSMFKWINLTFSLRFRYTLALPTQEYTWEPTVAESTVRRACLRSWEKT